MGQQQSRAESPAGGPGEAAPRRDSAVLANHSPGARRSSQQDSSLSRSSLVGTAGLSGQTESHEHTGTGLAVAGATATPLLRATSAAAALATGNVHGGSYQISSASGTAHVTTLPSTGTASRFHLMQVAAGRPLDAVTIVETVYGQMVGLGKPNAELSMDDVPRESEATASASAERTNSCLACSLHDSLNRLPAMEPPVLILDDSGSGSVEQHLEAAASASSLPKTTSHSPPSDSDSNHLLHGPESIAIRIPSRSVLVGNGKESALEPSASPESANEPGTLSMSLPSSPQLARLSSWRHSHTRDPRRTQDTTRPLHPIRHQSSSQNLKTFSKSDGQDPMQPPDDAASVTITTNKPSPLVSNRSAESTSSTIATASTAEKPRETTNSQMLTTGCSEQVGLPSGGDCCFESSSQPASSIDRPQRLTITSARLAVDSPNNMSTMTGHHHRSSTVDDERASKLDVGRGHLSMASRELHTPDATFSFATAIPVSVATLYFADPEKNGIFYEKSLASILHEWQRFRMECRRDLLIRSRTRLRALKAAALFSTSVVKSRGILTLKGVRRCLEHVDVRRIYLGHQQSRSRVGTEAATSLGFDNWDDTEGEQGLGSISSDDTGAAALDQQEQSASMSSEPPSDRKPATDATVPLAEPETGRSPKRMWTTRDDDDDDDTSEDEDVSYDSDSEYSDDESKDQLGRSIPATCSSRHESRAPQRSIALSDAASSIVDQSTTATATSELHRDTVTEATTTQNTITDTSATQPLNTQNKSTPSSGDYAREVERLERRASRWQLYTSHNLLPWGEQRLCDKFDQFDLGVIRRTRSWPTMGPHDASAHVDHTALMAGVFIEGRTTTGFEHFDLTEAAISLEAAARMLRHDITRLAELMEDNEEERIQFSTWLLRLATGGHIRDDLQTPDSLRGIHNPGATRSGADGLKQTQKADQEGIAAAANTQTTDQLQSLVKRTTMRSAEDEIQTGSIVDLRGIAAVLRMFWEDCIDVFEADFANRRHYYFSYSDADTLEAFQQLLDGIVESFSPAASLSVSHRESRHFLTTEEFMSLADLLARMYVRQKNRMECVGRYEIGRILGRGSEGRVHVARDLYTGRRYAIKMIRRGNFVEFARIDREVQAMQVVARHPNVIHLHEVLESRRHVYLVMELCGGGSVHEFAYARTCCSNEQLRRGKPEPLLDEAEARYLMRRLLTTVAFCHAHGVSHRDLRLNNLMLLDNGELKIADFGQVGLFSAGWDMFETNLVGSLYNLAPELVQGQVYQSTKVDVWSCGVILYWLLEGHPPFPEEDLNRLIPAIVQCRYAPMRAASPLARDLIQQILVPPAERPEAATLLEHAFFASPASTKTLAPHGTPEMAPSSPEAATGVTTNMAGQSSPPSSAWERPLRMDVRDFALCDTVMIQSMELDGGSLALQTMSSVLSDGDIHFHPGLCIELHRRCRWTLRCYWPEHDIKFSIALVAGPPRDDDGYLCCCGGEFQFHRRAFPSRRQRPAFVYTLSFRRRGGGSLLFMRAVCKIADRFYHRYQRVIQHADAGTLPDTEHAASECCQSSDPSSVGIRRGSLESRMNPLRFSRPVRRLLHRLHLSSAASRHESPRQAPSPGSSSGCGGVGPVGDE